MRLIAFVAAYFAVMTVLYTAVYYAFHRTWPW